MYKKETDYHAMVLGGAVCVRNSSGSAVDWDCLVAVHDSLSVCFRSAAVLQRVHFRKEPRGGNLYWYAYGWAAGRLHKRYVGLILDVSAILDFAVQFDQIRRRAIRPSAMLSLD